jgi:hypothetical protein
MPRQPEPEPPRYILDDSPGDGPDHRLYVIVGDGFIRYELTHIPACDHLRYGQKCHLAKLTGQMYFRDLWPQEPGVYHGEAWATRGSADLDPDEGIHWWTEDDPRR